MQQKEKEKTKKTRKKLGSDRSLSKKQQKTDKQGLDEKETTQAKLKSLKTKPREKGEGENNLKRSKAAREKNYPCAAKTQHARNAPGYHCGSHGVEQQRKTIGRRSILPPSASFHQKSCSGGFAFLDRPSRG